VVFLLATEIAPDWVAAMTASTIGRMMRHDQACGLGGEAAVAARPEVKGDAGVGREGARPVPRDPDYRAEQQPADHERHGSHGRSLGWA
jgi:hypothetical protein